MFTGFDNDLHTIMMFSIIDQEVPWIWSDIFESLFKSCRLIQKSSERDSDAFVAHLKISGNGQIDVLKQYSE